jgi:hypothetical protein
VLAVALVEDEAPRPVDRDQEAPAGRFALASIAPASKANFNCRPAPSFVRNMTRALVTRNGAG